jgi:hypothetical protein
MAVVAGLIRARRNKTGPALPAARALPARVVADLLCAEPRAAKIASCDPLGGKHNAESGHLDPAVETAAMPHAEAATADRLGVS